MYGMCGVYVCVCMACMYVWNVWCVCVCMDGMYICMVCMVYVVWIARVAVVCLTLVAVCVCLYYRMCSHTIECVLTL